MSIKLPKREKIEAGADIVTAIAVAVTAAVDAVKGVRGLFRRKTEQDKSADEKFEREKESEREKEKAVAEAHDPEFVSTVLEMCLNFDVPGDQRPRTPSGQGKESHSAR
jgi:hypothetical protein